MTSKTNKTSTDKLIKILAAYAENKTPRNWHARRRALAADAAAVPLTAVWVYSLQMYPGETPRNGKRGFVLYRVGRTYYIGTYNHIYASLTSTRKKDLLDIAGKHFGIKAAI